MSKDYDDLWSLTLRLINHWWRPLTEEDHVSAEALAAAEQRLGITLPAALREWHQLAGRRQDFIGAADIFLSVEELEIKDDTLVFCIEHQGMSQWGIPLNTITLADPPVMVDLSEYPPEDRPPRAGISQDDHSPVDPWFKTSVSVSEFMFEMVVVATKWTGKFTGSGPITPQVRQAVEGTYTPLRFPNGKLTDYFGDDDTLLMMSDGYAWVTTRTRAALERFLDLSPTWREGEKKVSLYHNSAGWSHPYNDFCRDVPPPYIAGGSIYDQPGLPFCQLGVTNAKQLNYRHKDKVKKGYFKPPQSQATS